MKDQCFTCHNGTGSIYNTQAEYARIYHHTLGGQDTGSTKQCSNCHEAHLLQVWTKRMLKDPQNLRTPWDIIEDVTSPSYNNTTPPSGIYIWCQRCHFDSEATPIGYVILNTEMTESRYIPYSVQVIWQTPKSTVDDKGDTVGYWQYYSTNTIPTTPPALPRYGYNDATAKGHSSHGKASLSDYGYANITNWYGPYGPNYPALPCTVCHDNHGANQPWMIVDSITVGGVTTAGYDMKTPAGQKAFCEACHIGTYLRSDLTQKCTNCHRHGYQF
jgi:hypothetical protein